MPCRRLIVCCTGLILAAGFTRGAVISDLRVEQPVAQNGQVYSVGPTLKIYFNLSGPAEVTVDIRHHLADYFQFKWPWLKEPYPTRTLALGHLEAGPHEADWDGMDEQGKPVVEVHNLTTGQISGLTNKPTTPDQLTESVPIQYFQVNVEAGGEKLSANFQRAVGGLQPTRTALPFRMGTLDRAGRYLVADFNAWSVYGYTADFVRDPDAKWPSANMSMGFLPAECSVVHVDSQGMVLIMDVIGIWRYDAKGNAAPWPAAGTTATNRPAYFDPGYNGEVLGTRSGDAAKMTQPGIAKNYTGFAVDDHDVIYLVRAGAVNAVDVFDDNGAYQRSITLPAGKGPGNIAWAGNGTLAVADSDSLLLIDAASGTVKKTIHYDGASFVMADPGGTIYVGNRPGWMARYTAAGEPVPFNSSLLYVKGNQINLTAAGGSAPSDPTKQIPRGAAGFAPAGLNGLAFAPDGSFYVSEAPPPGAIAPTVTTGLYHYAKDGTFLPNSVLAQWGCHNVCNVYLDDEPATLDLLVTNFNEAKRDLTVDWTLTNFFGQETKGTSTITAQPLARQWLPFTMTMPEMGQYRLKAVVRDGGRFVEELHAQLARIPSRPIVTDRYSPFAVAWVGEWETMALAGAKSSRGDQESWSSQVEPIDGVFFPDHPQVPQWARGGFDSLRAFGHRWGFLNLGMLDYGEHWLGGDQFIYSYDRFFDYCLHVIDTFKGKHEAFYQTWNEPNFFWRYASPDPFAREQLGVLQAHVWSMIKARDKDALSISDGDAGSTQIMQDFATFGTTGYIDTVQMHYPASSPISYNNMPVPDLPETKATAIAKLVEVRDQFYPGKPVWNTEEGIPPNAPTPELAATNLPRVEIPQFAVGVDRIYQFSQTAVEGTTLHDPTAMLDENGQPFPTYAAYATMTRLIDGAIFSGQADFGVPGTCGYLFTRGKDFILAVNSLRDPAEVTIDAGAPVVTVTDLMGRTKQMPADGGKLKITLLPQMQYLALARTSPGALAIAQAELKKELDALHLTDAKDIPAQVDDAAKTAATDLKAMNRLYHLVKAAEISAAAGEKDFGEAGGAAREARQAVEAKEGDDGYLRNARIALEWAEHLAQTASHDPSMAGATRLAARATREIVATEAPIYPGAAINAYIGEPGQIEKIRSTVSVPNKPDTGIDVQFRFQIDRKAGDSFEMELTMNNFYRHPISGMLTPRLPEGWTAKEGPMSYNLEPGKRQRFIFNVQVPADAKTGVYPVGGGTTFNGAQVVELHPSRIKL
jgi:hypothetical protein